MENFDLILLTIIVVIAFTVFIVTSLREFSKMEKNDYKHNPNEYMFGRNAVYQILEKLLDETKTNDEKRIDLFKTIDRTIADMESDGVYFSKEIKDKLENERNELFCEYSGLPSVKAYE